ncbi:MAG: DNA (cytosine-5-)-methyltransferase [Nitrospirae bacterium]|nr:DNA (cytosine-5-)-methyltransferase [Nitrospirota bacterium]
MDCVELCAGAGGQAAGLHAAGFAPIALVEIDKHACDTLRANRPSWNIIQGDIAEQDVAAWRGVDLLAGGFPCPPFSKAGKQLGEADERNLFDVGLDIVDAARPRAIMFENVRGILDTVFDDYRGRVMKKLQGMGYSVSWRLLNASDFGVPQLRPRVVFVAMPRSIARHFNWPIPQDEQQQTVGYALLDLMAANRWSGAALWANRANDIAPTIVGGSKKHGGPDLGPTRAKKAWASLGVDGGGIADSAPSDGFVGMPRLTVRMVARLQGFPDAWEFCGKKTNAYRQVGNAFPPPVAQAVASSLAAAFEAAARARRRRTAA